MVRVRLGLAKFRFEFGLALGLGLEVRLGLGLGLGLRPELELGLGFRPGLGSELTIVNAVLCIVSSAAWISLNLFSLELCTLVMPCDTLSSEPG